MSDTPFIELGRAASSAVGVRFLGSLGSASIKIRHGNARARAVGTGPAAALANVVQGLLHGVDPLDPLTFAAVSTLLVARALVAALIPALRAARADPVVSLRID